MEIRYYLELLKRKALIFLVVFVSILGTPLALSMIRSDIYAVSTKVMITTKEPQITITDSLPEKYGELNTLKPDFYYDTFLDILEDSANVKSLLEKLDLDEKTNKFLMKMPFLSFLFSSKTQGLSVKRVGETDAYEITGYASDADRAAVIAKSYIAIVIEKLNEYSRRSAEKLLPLLEENNERLEDEIAASELLKIGFMESLNISNFQNQLEDLFERLTYHRKELFSINLKYQGFEKVQNTLLEMMKELPDLRLTSSEMALDPGFSIYKSRLAELTLKLIELKAENSENHPSVRLAESMLEETMKKAASEQVKFFSKEIRTLNAQEDTLLGNYLSNRVDIIRTELAMNAMKEMIHNLESETTELSRKKLELDRLNEQVARQKLLYEKNLKAIDTARFILKTDIANALILVEADPELGMENAYFPDLPVTFLLSSCIAGFFAFFMALFVDYMDDRIKRTDDLMSLFPFAPISCIPRVRRLGFSGIKADALSGTDRFTSHLWRLGSAVSAVTEGKRILVCSTVQGEGKTAISLSLTRLFRAFGKRVVYLGLDSSCRGLKPKDCDQWMDLSGVIDNPGTLNDSDWQASQFSAIVNPGTLEIKTASQLSRLNEMLEILETLPDLDLIVMDTAGAAGHPLAAYLAESAACVVFVARVLKVRRPHLENTLREMESVFRNPSVFTVINGVGK